MSDIRGERTSMRSYLPDEPLDLNTATRDQLRAVRGIGDSRAERIVSWREQHGRFEAVEDLQQVPGIGPDVVAELRPHFGV
ncbi:MAG TPA: helix-hairpin-helix domain-containing protein [Rhodopila sp.]|nr:helix-hairpin-helix domain-containing protein [Rhodopila sp.]